MGEHQQVRSNSASLLVTSKPLAVMQGWVNGHVEWVEGTLILAAAMKDGRDRFLADTAFGAWLKKSGLNFYNAHDRAALADRIGGNLPVARKILTFYKPPSHSYELIWDQVQDRSRFGSAAKPRRWTSRRSAT